LQLTFSDNGFGISVKELPFIFDKFYRISSEEANQVSGFGLGLYYVKKICQQHHWEISAESNASGTSIILIIPNFYAKN